MHVLGIFCIGLVLLIPITRVPKINLLQLLDTPEFDEQNDWVDLILLKFPNCVDVDVQEAVLVVGDYVLDRSQSSALKMASTAFKINENIV